MPWTVEDVDSHMEGLTDEQKAKWVEVANAALDACTADGGEDCDAKAIMTANAAVKEETAQEPEAAQEEAVQEAVTVKAQAQGLLRVAKSLLGEKTLPQTIHAAIDSLRAALKRTWADLEADTPPDKAEDTPTEDAPAEEAALDVDFVPLVEKSVRPDSTIPVKIIQPGWGSSGFYSAEVLKRDGAKAFPAGTKMYWNHPTPKEEAERPERDLRDLAAELVTPAAYREDGQAGPGLYADAKVFSQFKGAVDELAPHIGVSIRATGRAKQGEAEGRKGPMIEEIVAGRSVDFVTVPGAGGHVLSLFESARVGTQPATSTQEVKNEVTQEEAKKLTEENAALAAEVARLKEAALLHEARTFTEAELAKVELPDLTRARLADALAAKPIVKDGALDKDAFAQTIREAANAEADYLATVAPTGAIRGMGNTGEPYRKAALKESYRSMYARMGKSAEEAERLAEIAARGR